MVAEQQTTTQVAEGYWAPRAAAISHTPTPDEYEAVVVARAQAGEEAAFEWLYRRYWAAIYNHVYRLMGDPADAEDLATDAFLKAWLALPQTKPDLRFGAWLYRIATNVCLDELRHRRLVKWQPWEAFVSVFHPSQVAKDSPERDAVRREDAEEVEAILKNVLPKYRTALLLREYHGLSYDEIAEALATTRAAVKSLLYRAREDFRHFYARATRQPGRATERKAPATTAAEPLAPRGRGVALLTQPEEGERLSALRKALGLRQGDVARRARCSHHTLSRLEKQGLATARMFRQVREALDALEAERVS